MTDKSETTNTPDLEIGTAVEMFGKNGGDPEALLAKLVPWHKREDVIEAIQRAFERGEIWLSSDGMVLAAGSRHHVG